MHYTKLASGDNKGNFVRLYSTDIEQLRGAINKLLSYKWSNIPAYTLNSPIENEAYMLVYTRKGFGKNFLSVAKMFPQVWIQVTSFSIIYGYEDVVNYVGGSEVTNSLYDDTDKYYYVWGDKELLYSYGFIDFDEDEQGDYLSLNSNYLAGYDSLEQESSGNPYELS